MHILRCTEGDRQWRAIQSWNCFKRFTKKRQDYNSNKLLSFVDEKISALLTTRLPDDSFILPRRAKSHIKNVLGLALYFCYLFDAKFNIPFQMGVLNTLE